MSWACTGVRMSATEFWIWWYTDEATGKRRGTTYKMKDDSQGSHRPVGEAQPVPGSMEVRDLADAQTDSNKVPGGWHKD